MNVKREKPAIENGTPVRAKVLPYAKQELDKADIDAVTSVLRSDWLTCGEKVAEFETKVARFTSSRYGIAVNSGTAALHAAMFAIGIKKGDEVIVPALTFVATANCVIYQGGKPVFADVDAGTLLIDPKSVEQRITKKTRAVIAVDFAGHPADYDALRKITKKYKLVLIDDACHAIGGAYKATPVGSLADLNTFSFHPAKHITTGEGGIVTTDNPEYDQRMRMFRNHGINLDFKQRVKAKTFGYDMTDLGFNYRLTDFQCALGISQLNKLKKWVKRRQEIAETYNKYFKNIDSISILPASPDVSHAWHIYIIKLELDRLTSGRDHIFQALRAEGIGVNVHYRPVYLNSFYRHQLKFKPGLCPVAERAYAQIITLPMYSSMTDRDVHDVIAAVRKVIKYYSK